MRRSASVWRPAFTSRFSTIRSTFGGSTASITASVRTATSRPGERVQVLDRAPCERADVGHPQLGLDDPAVQPVDVEQVLQEPVELARVAGQAAEQVGAVLVADRLGVARG